MSWKGSFSSPALTLSQAGPRQARHGGDKEGSRDKHGRWGLSLPSQYPVDHSLGARQDAEAGGACSASPEPGLAQRGCS